MSQEKWHTPKQVAELLQVNEQTVRAWLRDQVLVGAKFGDVWRVSSADLEAFIRQARERGKRFEPSDELRAVITEKGYNIHDVETNISDDPGAPPRVNLWVEPLANLKLDFLLWSRRRDSGPEIEEYEGGMWDEDRPDEDTYAHIQAAGPDHSTVFIALITQLAALEATRLPTEKEEPLADRA